MSKVPENPVWTGKPPACASVPSCSSPEFELPAGFEQMDPAKQNVVKAAVTMAASSAITLEMQQQQLQRVQDRCSTEQWLDENEREWLAMDRMLRARPWATRKDQPFKYPFRDATNLMREAEGPWVGDDVDPPNRIWTRSDAVPWEVLANTRPVPEHPPMQRLILFAPEFGSDKSFDPAVWNKIHPVESCDIWTVSWQGWSDFDDMIHQILHKVLSFADAVSTVWVGHSFGAIVAYEVLKLFEQHHSPNLPVALLVSGCPAPHLFAKEYKPWEKYEWLGKLQTKADFSLLTTEQHKILQNEFQLYRAFDVDPITMLALQRGKAPAPVQDKYNTIADITPAQMQTIIGDLRVMKSYQFTHDSSKAVIIPLIAIGHDEDPLVTPEAVEAWGEYAKPGDKVDVLALEEVSDDIDLLARQGHGFISRPVPELVAKVVSVSKQYQLVKEADEMLSDIGPTNGDIPAEVDILVVGAGIAGITQAKALVETGKSVLVVDRYRTIGGIWMFYANNFSRVNSSEPAYRIVNQEGPGSRPNEDHSPRHDILRDIFTIAHKFLYGKIRCRCDVVKVDKLSDGTYNVSIKDIPSGELKNLHTKHVSFNVNRRLGKRRDLTWPNQKDFRGEEVYGYANEVLGLKFWGKRVIVVGAGAFAYENLRTALEHGARHVTILGRRAGTTSPKWIDMIAFLRPLDSYFNTNKKGNIISSDVWRQAFHDAGLPTPQCWDEGLLKPHNHTVSVSDLAYVGGYHGMVALEVGEIKCFRHDGQGVELLDGRELDVDIIIKATGFHLNRDVGVIMGKDQMYANSLMDLNVNYGAEPLLDGGQFGSSKGKVADEGMDDLDTTSIQVGSMEFARLGLPEVPMRNNPFGSAYVGGMLASAYNYKWLIEHQDYQKSYMETLGKPSVSALDTWISVMGSGGYKALMKVFSKLA